ncbi:T9SS type A sorting domain-containing protein [Flavobacterium zepuense]|uniref:T9SS type A sorting domain-containing protein n=1 Tax=Flavobacterium zepuense TaxID=2593302 RepID=A0A552VAI4_9FLAO|nr:DUF5074 domain-containing protein [Flavobacterium zepuense]TRW27486.1 T9SS type A sorting domain-containing protein [Flavobacterium zepuense]
MKKITFLAIALTAFGFGAKAQTFSEGVFVLNEGAFGANNASLSYISEAGVLQNDVYAGANGNAVLGDTAQSMGFNGEYAYVVLNASNKVEIVNASTLVHVAAVTTGLDNPRYIAFYGTNAYVTCWGDALDTTDDYVAVISLADNTVTSTIPVVEGPEKIIEEDGVLYVAHKGGYGFGNSVSVINAETNTVTQSLEVGFVPSSIVEEDGYLYVLCEGKPSWADEETPGVFYVFDIEDDYLSLLVSNFSGTEHPSNLQVDGNNFYYTLDSNIYHATAADTTPPTEPFIVLEEQGVYGVYGFALIDDKIYVGDAGDFVSAGKVYIYDTDGELLDDYTVGLLPNGFYEAPEATTGVKDIAALNVSVYPNPTSDVLYVNTTDAADVTIYDLAGRTVTSVNYTNSGINVSGLQKGTYLVEVVAGNAKTVKKVVIQ